MYLKYISINEKRKKCNICNNSVNCQKWYCCVCIANVVYSLYCIKIQVVLLLPPRAHNFFWWCFHINSSAQKVLWWCFHINLVAFWSSWSDYRDKGNSHYPKFSDLMYWNVFWHTVKSYACLLKGNEIMSLLLEYCRLIELYTHQIWFHFTWLLVSFFWLVKLTIQ